MRKDKQKSPVDLPGDRAEVEDDTGDEEQAEDDKLQDNKDGPPGSQQPLGQLGESEIDEEIILMY